MKKLIYTGILLAILVGSILGFEIGRATSPASVGMDTVKYCHKLTDTEVNLLPWWIRQYIPRDLNGTYQIYICREVG